MKKNWSWSVSGYFLGENTLEQIREVCRIAGLAGIEGAPHIFEGNTDSELETIRDEFDTLGLAIETFHLPFSRKDDDVPRHIRHPITRSPKFSYVFESSF